MIEGRLVIVRGAGDLATGVILRLVRAGFRVAALETGKPSAIRRTVSFSEALYDGSATVEGIRALRLAELPERWSPGDPVAVLEDPGCALLARVRPAALVDAIIAKRNLGTRLDMAPVVVALGPGFTAGVDAHAVVETNRGHDLGRVLLSGSAQPNTGVPGLIAGHGAERVIHAPRAGRVEPRCAIGDTVAAGDPVLAIGGEPVPAPIGGVVRGLIRPGFQAERGLKVADVDPRCVREHCFTASDKARAIGGGVLEALLMLGTP
ncbi:selenium-dependent molybdenum cofactor biosynthesis protein YqeB [Mesoterricola silvestris]|nr:selenium-dependent molybdenum cofactor biosynthesis protein YqeB [Mesoterricola silvestris]